MRTPAPVIAALASLAILAACSPAAAPTTAAPLPTVYTCQGGATCSHEQWDQEQAQQKLFVEAETVYRELVRERVRLAQIGGAPEPTATLKQRATGEYLATISSLLRHQSESGETREGPYEIVSLSGLEETVDKSEVGLLSCEDGSRLLAKDAAGNVVGSGQKIQAKTWFKREHDLLLAFHGTAKAVDACA